MVDLDNLPNPILDATAAAIGESYDCTRVWSAWGYGTMSQDDFVRIDQDNDRVAEIAKSSVEAFINETGFNSIVAERDALRAELESLRKQETIGTVTVQRWRGIENMINTDFDAVKNLPDGTYHCYASPVPAQQECTFHGADAQACMDYSKEVPCEFTWEQEAKRAFWCGLEIGAAFGSCAILPRWNEYIEKRKSELKGGENER